jgi:outer membrane protein OmpA-like peptidoglycan-associated protein
LGSTVHNLRLALRRAVAVKTYLVGAGIAEKRIVQVAGYGETRPICPGRGEECLRKNRRAEILILVKSPED